MSLDQLFKEALREYFREFLELFFPHVAAALNFERVVFFDKEMFTDLPDGSRREADLVAQVTTQAGDPELLLIHIEVQRERESDFARRMFQYYALLRFRHQVPVYPIVLYLRSGTGGARIERYEEGLFGERLLAFRYACISLPDLPADEYAGEGNPLAPALSAWMRADRAGRVARKVHLLATVARRQDNDARRAVLAMLVETGLPLDESEKVEFERTIRQEEEVTELLTIYEERGMEKAYRRSLQRILDTRFRPLPSDIDSRLLRIEKPDRWERLIDAAMISPSLEEWERALDAEIAASPASTETDAADE